MLTWLHFDRKNGYRQVILEFIKMQDIAGTVYNAYSLHLLSYKNEQAIGKKRVYCSVCNVNVHYCTVQYNHFKTFRGLRSVLGQ
jgi:hypothetical protein